MVVIWDPFLLLPADIEHLYVSDAALGAQDTKINKVEVPALGGGGGGGCLTVPWARQH